MTCRRVMINGINFFVMPQMLLVLSMHEQEGKNEIHLHVDVNSDASPITIRMP